MLVVRGFDALHTKTELHADLTVPVELSLHHTLISNGDDKKQSTMVQNEAKAMTCSRSKVRRKCSVARPNTTTGSNVDVQEDEGLLGVGEGVAVAVPAPVTAPAAAVDEGSSLLSHDEQQEAFFADPTANGAAGLLVSMPATSYQPEYTLTHAKKLISDTPPLLEKHVQ